MSQKVASPLNFLQYFCSGYKDVSVKFGQFDGDLCPHISTNFGRFILIFKQNGVNFSSST